MDLHAGTRGVDNATITGVNHDVPGIIRDDQVAGAGVFDAVDLDAGVPLVIGDARQIHPDIARRGLDQAGTIQAGVGVGAAPHIRHPDIAADLFEEGFGGSGDALYLPGSGSGGGRAEVRRGHLFGHLGGESGAGGVDALRVGSGAGRFSDGHGRAPIIGQGVNLVLDCTDSRLR